jgi:prevent-host-death family protein
MVVSPRSKDRITATEARVHFGEVYRRVTENDEMIVIERNGKPGAVILSIKAYEQLRPLHGENRRPYWLENALRVGQAIAAEREGKGPIDWDTLIDEGRDEDE